MVSVQVRHHTATPTSEPNPTSGSTVLQLVDEQLSLATRKKQLNSDSGAA